MQSNQTKRELKRKGKIDDLAEKGCFTVVYFAFQLMTDDRWMEVRGDLLIIFETNVPLFFLFASHFDFFFFLLLPLRFFSDGDVGVLHLETSILSLLKVAKTLSFHLFKNFFFRRQPAAVWWRRLMTKRRLQKKSKHWHMAAAAFS